MTDGVRRLSHEEAEMLISARMDEQLDRADSRALLVHLQTCESCRAFAVQSEVLGRELSALPVLPPSTLVDRQIREAIGKGRSRWSLGPLMPAAGGSGGLRLAVGALAMLTLVSVFLLVRLAGGQPGDGPSIDAPNGGVAQQLDRTPTGNTGGLGSVDGPTETARVIVPPTLGSDSTGADVPTAAAGDSTEEPVATSDEPSSAQVEPTGTLDSSFVYTVAETRTPASGEPDPEQTAQAEPTEALDDVSVAAILADDATPVEEASPTETPGREPTGAASATATPADDPATVPAETVTAPIETPAEEPAPATETATSDADAEVPPTSTPEPTVTSTPIDLSVDPTEELPQPTIPVMSDESAETIAVESPESPITSNAPDAAPTEAPRPTETPLFPAADETPLPPFSQPTIAPIAGQTGADQGVGETSDGNDGQSTQIEFNDGNESSGDDSGQIVESAGIQGQDDAGQGGNDNGTGGSPPIVPSDDTTVTDGVGGATGQAGSAELQQPSAVPTVDDAVNPAGLDLSTTVTSLPAGTTSPTGRLEFSPGMNLYVVFAPDGQLAVANLDGELVVTLGAGDLPVWSGNGLMFSSGDQVGIWNSDTGSLSYVQPSENQASVDVPIGGDGSSFYVLRSYSESGAIEIRSATIDGQDDGVIWTSESATLAAERPLYSEDGVYLPTESEWLLIDWQGGETSLGANPYGYLGAPVLSPGGGLLAYSAGNQVIVAWTYDPGTAVATAPYGASGGYAFATSGEEIVVSDGSSLRVISYQGADLGTLSGNQPIGGVFWISDTIYYLQIGEDAALKSTGLAAIQEG